jgi:putative SOS response-associated peptidase YedK
MNKSNSRLALFLYRESSKAADRFDMPIVDGMNVRDSRVYNYPPRWNGAPSQELLVIRRNHQTGEVSLDPLRWGLDPVLVQRSEGRPETDQCKM